MRFINTQYKIYAKIQNRMKWWVLSWWVLSCRLSAVGCRLSVVGWKLKDQNVYSSKFKVWTIPKYCYFLRWFGNCVIQMYLNCTEITFVMKWILNTEFWTLNTEHWSLDTLDLPFSLLTTQTLRALRLTKRKFCRFADLPICGFFCESGVLV